MTGGLGYQRQLLNIDLTNVFKLNAALGPSALSLKNKCKTDLLRWYNYIAPLPAGNDIVITPHRVTHILVSMNKMLRRFNISQEDRERSLLCSMHCNIWPFANWLFPK